MTSAPYRQPLRLRELVGRHRVRPRIVEAKSGGFLFGRELRRRLCDGPEWLTLFPGVFAIGVVNAPESIGSLSCRVRFHAPLNQSGGVR